MITTICEIAGAALGIAGAVLTAGKTGVLRRTGFACWIVGNAFLITWGLGVGAYSLCGLYVFYIITSVYGWWNNRGGPCQGA